MVLPFGLTSAPRIFTKILKPIINHLQKKGYIVFFYLDDSLQKAPTFDTCLQTCFSTYNLLVQSGFLPNHSKSSLIPSQYIDILRFTVDSCLMKLFLPASKTTAIINSIVQLLDATDPSV